MDLCQRDFFISVAEKISSITNAYYLNYYNDTDFTDLDYYDSCHLNELKKLTQKSIILLIPKLPTINMLFNSLDFAIFLPIVFSIYWLIEARI